jgi:tetratricopeptide (TPR) repeat protein
MSLAVTACVSGRACLLALLAGATTPVPAVPAAAPVVQSAPARAGDSLADAAHALSAGDPARALELGTAYLKTHPGDARAHVLMARAHMAGGRFDDAYDDLMHALAADPRDMDALYYLGLVSARLSEREFRRLAAMAPDSPRLHQLMAESLDAQGKRAAAAREYQAALDKDPKLLPALLGLAKLKRIQLECDDAMALYTRAENVQPTFDGVYGAAVCESVLQDDEAAVGHFRTALERDPSSAVAWVGLGTSLNKLHRPAEAITALQKAIALEPAMGEAYYALGLAYRANRQQDLAAQAFKKAEQLGGALGGDAPSPGPPQ